MIKTARNIFRIFWSLWCAFVFAVTLIILFPFMVIALVSRSEKLIYYAHFVPSLASRITLFFSGVSVVVHNSELIDAEKQFIYISNHRSYLDALVSAKVIPNYIKFLGKGEILNWPIMGYIVKNFYVGVWRQDKQHRNWSMNEMTKMIKTGCSFYICPEGTCNSSTDFFIKFYDGAFRLSETENVPIVPLTFVNTGEIMPRSGLLLLPGTVHVYWHKPILPAEINPENLEEAKEKVKNIMREDLLKHHPSGKYPIQN